MEHPHYCSILHTDDSTCLQTYLARESHRVITSRAYAYLPDGGLASARKGRNKTRLEDILLITMPRVLVFAEGVYGSLPRQHARVYRPGVDLAHLAVKTVDPLSLHMSVCVRWFGKSNKEISVSRLERCRPKRTMVVFPLP